MQLPTETTASGNYFLDLQQDYFPYKIVLCKISTFFKVLCICEESLAEMNPFNSVKTWVAIKCRLPSHECNWLYSQSQRICRARIYELCSKHG